MSRYGFRLSKNKKYCPVKLGSLFDINERIPINYCMSKGVNERNILIGQLKHTREGDILVMDRGYYSKKLLVELVHRKLDFIFRLSSNNLFVKNYKGNNTIIDVPYDHDKTVKCKVIKYKVGEKNYYLLTNNLSKRSDTLSANYWNRWSIESDFRKVKYDILYNNIRSKTEKQVTIDVKILNIVGMLLGYIENIKKYDNEKVNSKNAISLFYDKLLQLFLYGKKTKEAINKICDIIGVIIETVELIRKNRNYKRIRILPSTKWNCYGIRYKKR